MNSDDPPIVPPRLIGASLITLLALAFWGVFLYALANFYIGNTGYGAGGDGGMWSAFVDTVAVGAVGVVLWLLLLGLLVWAAIRGTLSRAELLAGGVVIAMSWYATFTAQMLLTPSPQQNLVLNNPDLYPGPLLAWQRWPQPPFYWPIIEPALTPLLLILLAYWALLPGFRARVPDKVAYGLCLVGPVLLSIYVFAQ